MHPCRAFLHYTSAPRKSCLFKNHLIIKRPSGYWQHVDHPRALGTRGREDLQSYHPVATTLQHVMGVGILRADGVIPTRTGRGSCVDG